ncbi:MAG: shikimate dehydrogenase [Chitinophagaceae bacterium]|nr:shikimate dehydrogenase [Chitinophagaceae bacterium]
MRLYGLIGFPLTHSFSKKYFDDKFLREGLRDCSFENFPLKNIEEVKELLTAHANLKGFAVTIPYKKKIIRLLDEGTKDVRQMVACNCVKLKNGKLYGHNTDIIGFERSFTRHLQTHHNKALILGTGGGAEAVAYVFRKLQISYLMVSRGTDDKNAISYQSIDRSLLEEHTILVNCTPVGTFPDIDQSPPIPYEYIGPHHYLFDLVYNPAETDFMKKGRTNGATVINGYEMLVVQAEENWKIWNG